jgi:hypothetical protein
MPAASAAPKVCGGIAPRLTDSDYYESWTYRRPVPYPHRCAGDWRDDHHAHYGSQQGSRL